ncbi:hypothetical protein FKM82_030496 [Ascaphus truei]
MEHSLLFHLRHQITGSGSTGGVAAPALHTGLSLSLRPTQSITCCVGCLSMRDVVRLSGTILDSDNKQRPWYKGVTNKRTLPLQLQEEWLRVGSALRGY